VASEGTQTSSKPVERLKSEARGLVGALGKRALASVSDRVQGTSGRLSQYVEGGAGPGLMAAITGARGLAEGKSKKRSMLGAGMSFMKEKISGIFRRGGRKGGQRKLKLTNIVESVDVGVPVKLAYNQWTQYSDFPKFTKKVENVDHNKNEETKTNWKAQVWWSHRTWEATVIDQVPDDRIVWRSKGQKGHVDGAVTFHELAPNLTRVLLVMEYHPQGLFERTGNLWRAQGRRARLEFKHFRRHMMTEAIVHPDDIEGWRGTIHDGEVVESHEDAMAREEKEGAQQNGSRQAANGRASGRAEADESDERAESNESAESDERAESAESAETDERADARAEASSEQDEPDEDRGQQRRGRARQRAGRAEGSEPEEQEDNSDGSQQRPSRSRRPAPVSRTARGNERRSRSSAASQRGGSR
jgi:uncharacterized membrane protein